MALLISTNMYKAEDLKRVLPYLKRFDYKVGVEIFPMFHETEYKEILQECLMELKKVPISFHGPYYGAEHSIPGPDTENRKNGRTALMPFFRFGFCFSGFYGRVIRPR